MCPSFFQVKKFPDTKGQYFKIIRSISLCSMRCTCLEEKHLGELSGEIKFWNKNHSFQFSVQKTQHPRRAFYHCCPFITCYLTTKNVCSHFCRGWEYQVIQENRLSRYLFSSLDSAGSQRSQISERRSFLNYNYRFILFLCDH